MNRRAACYCESDTVKKKKKEPPTEPIVVLTLKVRSNQPCHSQQPPAASNCFRRSPAPPFARSNRAKLTYSRSAPSVHQITSFLIPAAKIRYTSAAAAAAAPTASHDPSSDSDDDWSPSDYFSINGKKMTCKECGLVFAANTSHLGSRASLDYHGISGCKNSCPILADRMRNLVKKKVKETASRMTRIRNARHASVAPSVTTPTPFVRRTARYVPTSQPPSSQMTEYAIYSSGLF